MLVERVKEICKSLGINYKGGDDFWLNISDYPVDEDKPFEERNKYLFFRPYKEDDIINSMGAIEGQSIKASVVLAVRSKISDSDWDYKYDRHIEPLKAIVNKFINSFGNCDNYLVKSVSKEIVTDMYDTNMDGWLVNFTLEQYD